MTGNVLELAVAENGMRFNYISELPQHQMKESSNFFEDYNKLENKTLKEEDFQNAA